jgi:hypothetical protein
VAQHKKVVQNTELDDSKPVKSEPVEVLRNEERIFHTASTFYYADSVSNTSDICNESVHGHTTSPSDNIPDTLIVVFYVNKVLYRNIFDKRLFEFDAHKCDLG